MSFEQCHAHPVRAGGLNGDWLIANGDGWLLLLPGATKLWRSWLLAVCDAGKHYPEDLVGEVHADSEIWSQALFQIRTALGPKVADRIIANAQFAFAPDTTFAAAARRTVATAQSMYGATQAAVVQKAFADRGIL
jgi:hypothetical protein